MDLAKITKTQKVDEESNYCFGEGGAALILMVNCILEVKSEVM